MKAYKAFIKKEFMEFTRTYKLFIMFAIFILLGLMNPFTAKLLPYLYKMMEEQGLVINMPAPSALDSWTQFYGNVPQMGLIAMVIIFSLLVSNEYTKGTLVNMLTKGLPRKTVIYAKLTIAILMWTLSYAVCFVISYVFTAFFWSSEGLSNIVFAAIFLWIYGILLIFITILGSIVIKNVFGGIVFAGGFVAVQMIIGFIPKISEYLPSMLSGGNLSLITGAYDISDFVIPIIFSIVLCVASLIASIQIFNKKSF